jgi:hypothetical protein
MIRNLALVTLGLAVMFTLLFGNIPFLWDNILIPSQTATFFYENGFRLFQMGGDLDCGHPPFLSIYYTLVWQLLGKTLLASHIGQLPFLWLSFYFLIKISSLFLSHVYSLGLMLLILIDTSFIAQCSQVGYEWPMVALVLFILFNILSPSSNKLIKCLAWCSIIILPLIQMRAVPMVMILFVIQILFYKIKNQLHFSKILKALGPYLFSGFTFFIWLAVHYYYTGYLITDHNSTWGPSNNGFATFSLAIYNFIFCIWLLLDYGHFVWYFIFSIMFILHYKKYKVVNGCLLLLLLPTCTAILNFSVMNKSIGHRYFLLAYLLMPLISLYYLQLSTLKPRVKTIIIGLIAIILGGSSFVMYADKYPKSWDSHAGSLNYYSIKAAALNKIMNDKRLSDQNFENIATRFPLTASIKETDLNSNKFLQQVNTSDSKINIEQFRINEWSESNYEKVEFILYSNASTNYTDADLAYLAKHFTINWQLKNGLMVIKLFQRNS